MYRVFLGAPSKDDLKIDSTSYRWQTVSSGTKSAADVTNPNLASNARADASTQPSFLVLPPATIEAANQRISLFYRNVIFDDSKDADEEVRDHDNGHEPGPGRENQTTVITWPPTEEEEPRRRSDVSSFLACDSSSLASQMDVESQLMNPSAEHAQHGTGSGPRDSSDQTTHSVLQSQSRSHDATRDYTTTVLTTQPTFSISISISRDEDGDASISRFPSFHFNPHAVTALARLGGHGTGKVCVLAAVLEVDGPDEVTIRKGRDAGKKVAVLRLVLGDEEGALARLTAWRGVAERLGGLLDDDDSESVGEGVKRGDVLFIENVTAAWDAKSSPTLTASPYLGSRAQICYRTLPHTRRDNRFRPDLRLGASDPAVRKVAAVVRWFERMAGLA